MTQIQEPPHRTLPQTEGFSHEPLRLRVAGIIRGAILDGSLLPGTPLVEKSIADDLDISRAPVREAIRMLAEEGLVESVPYKGSRVRLLSARDVQEVYSMRGLLERFAVRQILGVEGGSERLAPLEEACAVMDQAAAAGDTKALNDADERFHRSLIALAGHELLLDTWTLIALRARHAMALRNGQLGDPKVVAANHRAIVDALKHQDLERTLQLVTDHIESGTQLILDDWIFDQ